MRLFLNGSFVVSLPSFAIVDVVVEVVDVVLGVVVVVVVVEGDSEGFSATRGSSLTTGLLKNP